jgi:hypothetical protein
VWSFVVVLSAEVAFTFGTILQCWPVRGAWDPSIDSEHKRCANITAFWWSNGIWNIASDLFLILLPVPVIRKLNITLAKKIGLACMFSIGLVVIVTAVLRFTTLQTAARKAKYDPCYGSLLSTTWTNAEAALAVICANIPMLRQLLETCIPALKESIQSSRGTTAHVEEGVAELPDWANADNHDAKGRPSTVGEEASTHHLVDGDQPKQTGGRPDRMNKIFGEMRRSLSKQKIQE